MSLYSHSKTLFMTSLACFSLVQLSASSFDVYQCNTGNTNCNACLVSLDGSGDAAYTSWFEQPIACSSVNGCTTSGTCTSSLTGMFFYASTSSGANESLHLDTTIPYSTTTPTYIDFQNGVDRYIVFDAGGDFIEIGSQFTNTSSNTGVTYFKLQDDTNYPVTIYLSNPSNNFTSTSSNPTTFFIDYNTKLQLIPNSITGVDVIEFGSGYLTVPEGGTVTSSGKINDGDNAYLIGGNSQSTPLIMTGAWTGISGSYTGGPGVLYLISGFINPQAGAFGADSGTVGNISLVKGCTLMIGDVNALGNGTNTLACAGGILQFIDNIILPNTISFDDSYELLTVDMQGYSAGLSGSIYETTGKRSFVLNDTSSTPGTLTISSPSVSSFLHLQFDILRGTLAFDSGIILSTPVAIETEGVLEMNNLTYSGTRFTPQGGTALLLGDSLISGSMTGSGELNISRDGSSSASLAIDSALEYTGLLNCVIDTGSTVDVTVYSGLFNGTLNISPSVEVHYVCGPNSSGVSGSSFTIVGPIQSVGTYETGESSANGASLSIENSTGGDSTASLTAGNITGNLFIDIKNTAGGTNTINTNGYSITGCVQLDLDCTLNLNSSASILTLVNNQAASGLSQIDGNITGPGSVVVDVNTQFGSSTTTYPTNSFSSLTLTSGVLTAWNMATLGGSTPTFYGNGGTLDNQTTTMMTLENPWVFNGGTTTSFQGGGDDVAFEIIGSITTGGSGSATIDGNSELTLNPSSLNIITGTSFVTNGTSVTTGVITGSGGLVLGAGTNHSPINDTLIVTAASSYSGIISDSTYGGGIVRIQSAVSLLGENTFSKGLYLDSAGTLTINTAANLGAGTIYFNTGGLTLPLVGSGETVTAVNALSFTGGGTTVFDIYGSSSGTMELDLTGTSSITGHTTTANLTVTGGGILTIGTTFESGSTYNVSVSSGALVVNSTTTTVSSARPFLNDGVLKGVQDSWFSLADASYENWKITPVTLLPDPIMNVSVDGILAGAGEVTTAVINPGGTILPGDQGIGVFTVTDTLFFRPSATFIIEADGSSASLLVVGGQATIDSNAKAAIFPKKGIYTSASYVILTAGSLQGEFGSLAVPGAFFLDAALDYSVLNEIMLSINPRLVETGVIGANAISVAKALDKVVDWNRTHVDYELPIFGGGDDPLIPDVFESLIPLSPDEMSYALNQLQPAFFKGFTVIQENNIVKVQDALTLRMDSILQGNSCYAFQDTKECCSPNEKRIHTWISGLGDVLAQESNNFAGSPQVGYQGKTYGFATGVDGTFAKFLYAGAMGGYTSSYIKWRGHQGAGNINTGYAGLYLSAVGKMFYGNLSLIGGFSDMSSKRHIEYTGVDLTASGNHSGKQLLSHADTGINFSFGGVTIKPFDAFDYVSQTENSYVEKGAGQWGLSLKKSNAILLRNELGLEVSTCLCFKSMKWVVAPKASWVREVRVKGQSYTASFTEAAPADAPFTVTGYFPDRSLFSPGVSLAGSMCQDKVSVELNYQGEFTHGYSDHSYGAEVRVSF